MSIKHNLQLQFIVSKKANHYSLQFVDDETGKRAIQELQTPQMKSCRANDQITGDAITKARRIYPSWHHPKNWGSGEFSGEWNPQPHLHRIPCRHDEAVFPRDNVYKCASAHRIDVSRLSVSGSSLDSVGFRAMANTKIGRIMFNMSGEVYVHEDRCSDPEGCVCGNRDLRGVLNNLLCSMANQ